MLLPSLKCIKDEVKNVNAGCSGFAHPLQLFGPFVHIFESYPLLKAPFKRPIPVLSNDEEQPERWGLFCTPVPPGASVFCWHHTVGPPPWAGFSPSVAHALGRPDPL